MADVRSMLRNERQARRLTHPHLTYSTGGTLVCLVCHIQIKSENLWSKHLVSDQHVLRLQRIRDNTLGRPPGSPPPDRNSNDQLQRRTNWSKKRKADDSDEDSRKKSKPVAQQYFEDETDYNARFHLSGSDEEDEDGLSQDATTAATTTKPQPAIHERGTAPPKQAVGNEIDEDEWAAFERDVAAPLPEPSALTAEATISAAPISAEELAVQSREEASAQRKSFREAEMEGEKEDAARQIEEEFDEMAELEERVKRLREKREKLRVAKAENNAAAIEEEPERYGGSENGNEQIDVDDSDDEGDTWDLWAR